MKKMLKTTARLTLHYAEFTRKEGAHSGLSGNCSGLSGNCDLCELTNAEREAGVKITDLVEKA